MTSPTITLFNRQRAVRADLPWLRRFAAQALARALTVPARHDTPLQRLQTVEASLVSDRAIAAIHARFFNDPSPTDVITFDHGEILLGAETVAANARRFRSELNKELGLCILHGLLHLNGYQDGSPTAARRMHRVQSRLLRQCLAKVGLFCCLVLPAPAQTDGPPVNAEAILQSLPSLRARHETSLREQRARTLQRIESAAATPAAAAALYQEAIRATRFEGATRETSQFRDWKKRQDEKSPDRVVEAAAQLHLAWLAQTLRHCYGTKIQDQLEAIIGYTRSVFAQPARVLDDPLAKTPLPQGVFARWFQLENELHTGADDQWVLVPRDADRIWEKIILPELRQSHDPRAVEYWNERLEREAAAAKETGRTFDVQRFASARRPELLWNRATEMLAIGLRNRAIQEMVGIVKNHPDHPAAGAWIREIERLLQPAPAEKTPPASQPAPGPTPAG